MKQPRIVFGLLSIVLIFMTLVSGKSFPLILEAILVFLILVEGAGNQYLKHRLRFSIAKEGIKVENTSFLPVCRLRLRVQMTNVTTGKKQMLDCTTVQNGKSEETAAWEQFTWSFEHQQAGFYEIELVKAELFDDLGVLAGKIVPECTGSHVKLPSYHAVRLEELTGREDSSEMGNCPDHRNSYGDICAVREYIPGDALRQIHFKLSAKFDQLYVRESEAEEAQRPVLIYETLYDTEAPGEDEIIEELEEFFSRSIALLQAGVSHDICWYDGQRKQVEQHEVDTLEMLMEQMMLLMRCGRSQSVQSTRQMAG